MLISLRIVSVIKYPRYYIILVLISALTPQTLSKKHTCTYLQPKIKLCPFAFYTW